MRKQSDLQYVWKGENKAQADWAKVVAEVKAFDAFYKKSQKWLKTAPLSSRVPKYIRTWDDNGLPLDAGRPLGIWVRNSLGLDPNRSRQRTLMGDLYRLQAKPIDPSYRKALLKTLEAYRNEIQDYISQAGAARFNHADFLIKNPYRMSDKVVSALLVGVNYVVQLFKSRGVTPLLSDTVTEILFRPQMRGETAHGWYHAKTRQIEVISKATSLKSGKMLKHWVNEIFLHEVGHHVHLSLLAPLARKEWDSGWSGINDARKSDEEAFKNLHEVSYEERLRFWDLLISVQGNLRKIKLKGLPRMKFHAWLAHPTMGGSYVTKKQLRWTKDQGYRIPGLLGDPETFARQEWGLKPTDPSYDKRVARAIRQIKSVLAATDSWSSYAHPILTENEIKGYAKVDSQVAEAFVALGAPTDYAKTNEKEDFAETFVAFMASPGRLSANANFRMKRTLSLSGLYGKPIMRVAQAYKKNAIRALLR